jgi:hypothetical protein
MKKHNNISTLVIVHGLYPSKNFILGNNPYWKNRKPIKINTIYPDWLANKSIQDCPFYHFLSHHTLVSSTSAPCRLIATAIFVWFTTNSPSG